MNENIKELLKKIQADKELVAKFARMIDWEEAYQLAVSVQDGFTREEFIAEMKKIREEYMGDLTEGAAGKVSGLNDNGLARAARGSDTYLR